jgi:hypothetical protein
MIRQTVLFCFSLLLFSCKEIRIENVLFSESQPSGDKSLNTIPNTLKGDYFNSSDSSYFLIRDNLIIKTREGSEAIHIDSLRDDEKFTRDTIFEESVSTKIIIKRKGDSVFTHYIIKDTFFSLCKENIVKKYKGIYYFNNYDQLAKAWSLFAITKNRKTISIQYLDSLSSKRLQTICGSTDDSSQIFSPTKKQFREFLRFKPFYTESKYVSKQ